MDDRVSQTSRPASPHDTRLLLPPELLFEICCRVVAKYVDDMVLGPLQYVPPPHTFFAASGPPPHEGPHLDLALSSPNPVVALLQASFDLRHATLRALSEALDIRLDRTGLGSLEEKPWTRIHPMRVRVWGARESTFTDDTARAEVPPLRASPTLVQLYELVAMLIEGFRFTIMRVLPNMPESIADGGDESMYAYVFERCPMMRIYEGALDGLSELEQRGLTMYALRRLLALECVGFYAFPLFYLFDPEAADFRIFDGIKAMPADDALARIEMSLCYLKAMVAQGAFDLWDQHGPCAREWWPYYRDYCGFEEILPAYAQAVRTGVSNVSSEAPPLISQLQSVLNHQNTAVETYILKVEAYREQLLEKQRRTAL